MLYSDTGQLLSVDAVAVYFGIVFSTTISFYSLHHLATGSEVPLVHNAAAFGILLYLLWAHWRLEFDLISDLFKIEAVLLVFGFILVFSTIMIAGIPENVWAVPMIRASLSFTISVFFAIIWGFQFAFLRTFQDRESHYYSDDF